MTEQWLNEVCKPGQGASACSYLAVTGEGWRCAKLIDGLMQAINARREAGTMQAQGDNCSGDGDFLIVPPLTAANIQRTNTLVSSGTT